MDIYTSISACISRRARHIARGDTFVQVKAYCARRLAGPYFYVSAEHGERREQMSDMGYGVADAAGRAEIDRLNDEAREARIVFDYGRAWRLLKIADDIRTGRQD